jgi:predicted amino acid dehydrogenase
MPVTQRKDNPHGTARQSKGSAQRFAFVLHPLTVDYLGNHPHYSWTRHLPRKLVEVTAAYMPAQQVGRVTGGRSPVTGQAIEGLIYALGMTPRQMLTRAPEFTYTRLDQAVRDAAQRGARIVGLGAFTKVVGDAGVTVAKRAPIPVTTGNSLTIAATLETAKLTAKRMGWPDLARGKAMIVGATGAIGSVCSRVEGEDSCRDAERERRTRHCHDALGGRVRSHRNRDIRVRSQGARRQPMQARRRHPRRCVAAGHLR